MKRHSIATRYAKRLVLETLEGLRGGYLELACPDANYSFGDPGASLKGMVVVHDENVFRRAIFHGEIGLGEAFMEGEWSSPNLVNVVRVVMRNLHLFEDRYRVTSLLSRWWERLRHALRDNSIAGSRRNIAHHYDLGNDFYRLFLDKNMAYSCAYYENAGETLDSAQVRKFDRICRKLRLGPEDHLLETGTGWGGFAAHAATQYRCRVTTTTISRQQHSYASEWFARLGANARIESLFEDYRKLRGQFDKIVSIEMFEAVGFDHYDEYLSACDRLLKPDGVMLLQTITHAEQRNAKYRRRRDWIQKYIFPGAELASVKEILSSLARSTQLCLAHAEDIGRHYAQTLHAWRACFHASLDAVRRLGYDERFIRMWDFYLASCEGGFFERAISDFQLVLSKVFNPRPLLDEPCAVSELAAHGSTVDSVQ